MLRYRAECGIPREKGNVVTTIRYFETIEDCVEWAIGNNAESLWIEDVVTCEVIDIDEL